MAVTKIHPIKSTLKQALDYIENPDKTDGKMLVSSFGCSYETADIEFEMLLAQAMQKGNNLAHHLIQSFAPGEATPEQAHEIGRRLADEVLQGKYPYVLTTHIDKGHVHNHIIVSAVNLESTRKFRNFWGSSWALRRISDKLCLEHGLSIVEDPKPSRGHYGKWLGDGNKPLSFQNQIRQAIDAALEQHPSTFEDFLKILEASGVEVTRRGKSINFRVPGQKSRTRCNTLKGDYTEQYSLCSAQTVQFFGEDAD